MDPFDIHPTTEDWIDRLHRDVLAVPDEGDSGEAADDGLERINYATLEFELERSRKRLAVWDIFLSHMKQGAGTWDEVRHALTVDDLEAITAICNGLPLREVLSDAC
jgi:hypothetical protein